MKRRITLISVLVAALLLCLAATPAFAYFTDHHTADGGLPIKTNPWPEQEEWVAGGKKHVIVTNTGDGDAYVRVGIYASSAIPILEVATGDGWSGPEGDSSWNGPSNGGWYYYNKILKPGEKTTELSAELSLETSDETQLGENYNVIVSTECSPVKYGENGNPSAANWSHSYSS